MANVKTDLDNGPFHYWRVMTALQAAYAGFTSRVLVDILGDRHRKGIERYLAFLLAEKVLAATPCREGAAPHRQYVIVNGGEAPPLRRGPDEGLCGRQQALWTAIRNLRQFSASELAIAASTETASIPRATAAGYVRDLLRAGYLAETARQGQVPFYKLLPGRNTGPRAPIVLRSEAACFDLNLMRSVNVTASQTGRAA